MDEIINSSSLYIAHRETIYISSGSATGLSEQWGQPPASHYIFEVNNNVLYGQLVEGVNDQFLPLPPDPYDALRLEMRDWESIGLSDLSKFESDLE
ncbi:MAG TPA: hypothetical protein VKF38_03370 [Anaerolineaceae bacterium]|nr:hypothetical protein [Anaerolineaceae bacterium]